MKAAKMEKGQKKKDFQPGKRGTLLRLSGYLMKDKWLLGAAVLLTIGRNLFALIAPCYRDMRWMRSSRDRER